MREKNMVFKESEEALSGAIGFVLILATIIISSTLLYTQGMPVLDAAEKSTHLVEMEQSFSVLKASMNEVAFAQAPSRTSELKIKGGHMSLVNGSWIDIAGARYTLGSIEYKLADRTIAYENSAVFVKYLEDGNTLMLAEPRVSLGNISYLPLIQLAGSESKGGEGVIRIIARADTFTSPLHTNNTTVIIKSDYYREWGRYFNESFGLSVSYSDVEKSANVTFLSGSKIFYSTPKINIKIA